MPDNKNDFKPDTSKKNIAAQLSIKPETFSRIVKNMNSQGILTIRGSKVSIHDAEALKQKNIG